MATEGSVQGNQHSYWFFLDWDFAIQTVSRETVINPKPKNSNLKCHVIIYSLTWLVQAVLGNIDPQSYFCTQSGTNLRPIFLSRALVPS